METSKEYKYLIVASSGCNTERFYPLGEFNYVSASELDEALDRAGEKCLYCSVWIEMVPPGMEIPTGNE